MMATNISQLTGASFLFLLEGEWSNRTQIQEEQMDARFELLEQKSHDFLQKRKTMNDRIVEELRPLCEELPVDALDPVTYEPLDRSIAYRCGHALNISTVVNIASMQGLKKQDPIRCPSCNLLTPINRLYPYMPIRGCVEIFKKISEVFKKYN